MELIVSNAYLTIFGAGTLVGAASTYIFLKFMPKADSFWEKGQEEKFEFSDDDNEYRLTLAVRNDLKMQKGKIAAQCGHAAVAAYAKCLREKPHLLKKWYKNGGTKIAVKLESENELFEIDKRAKQLKVFSCIVRDAGQTQVAPGTRTVIAIGPAPRSVLDKITGHLKLL